MGNQFKKPFSNPEEQPPQASPPSFIPEQNTLMAPPAVNMPPGPNIPPAAMPPQGYVQGQHGQYGPRPSGLLFHGAGQFGKLPVSQPITDQQGSLSDNQIFGGQQSNMPVNQMFGGQQDNMSVNQVFGGQQSNMPANQMFGGQQGNMPINQVFGGQQSNMPVNSLFGSLPETPAAGNPLFPFVSGISSPNANWNGQRSSTSELREKPSTVRERERNQASKGKKGKKKRRVPIWARVVIGFLLVLVIAVGGGIIYYQVTYAPLLNSVTGQQFTRQHGEEDPNAGKTGSILNWGRINILLLGSDTDEKPVWGGNSFLAQTVIVVSIDTNSHDVDMLSIPRDYYISIPGYGLDKLDTAFSHGGSINNHMSGVGEVVATLDQDFGVKINYYAWVGLQGFIKVIDTVKGVDVNVVHPVVDDTYPDDVTTKGKAQSNYKRVYIPDGPQHLDGPTALEYVRSRHSTNDFDRSVRQQQVLSALKLKLSNPGIFGDLPQIAKDLQGSVATNLSATQVLDLGNFARSISPDKIKHLTLGGTQYSTTGKVKTSYGTEDVVYPRCDTVPGAINSFLHITTAACNITLRPGQQSPQLASSSSSGTGGFAAVTAASASIVAPASNALALGQDKYTFSDLFGMRDIIDLMSMVVLDSPQA